MHLHENSRTLRADIWTLLLIINQESMVDIPLDFSSKGRGDISSCKLRLLQFNCGYLCNRMRLFLFPFKMLVIVDHTLHKQNLLVCCSAKGWWLWFHAASLSKWSVRQQTESTLSVTLIAQSIVQFPIAVWTSVCRPTNCRKHTHMFACQSAYWARRS